MHGVDHHRRQPALKGQQQALETGVIVDDVEVSPGHGGVDPGQVGGLSSRLGRPTEVVAPGGVGQHGDPRLRAFSPEHCDLVAHAAELDVEQVDHQLRPSVTPRWQRVPGWRDEGDPKRVVHPVTSSCPRGCHPMITVGLGPS